MNLFVVFCGNVSMSWWKMTKYCMWTSSIEKLWIITYLKTNLMISSSKQSFEEETSMSVMNDENLEMKTYWSSLWPAGVIEHFENNNLRTLDLMTKFDSLLIKRQKQDCKWREMNFSEFDSGGGLTRPILTGTMAYKLGLPNSLRVHPIFHVSCLKKVIGENLPVQKILLELDEEGKIILEPEAVMETRNW